MICCFSFGSIIPAESNKISAMLPGTMRSNRKIAIDTPNRVTIISNKRRMIYDSMAVQRSSQTSSNRQ